jgi:hypothetical protein
LTGLILFHMETKPYSSQSILPSMQWKATNLPSNVN